MLGHFLGAFLLVWIHYGADEGWAIMCYPPMNAKGVQARVVGLRLRPCQRAKCRILQREDIELRLFSAPLSNSLPRYSLRGGGERTGESLIAWPFTSRCLQMLEHFLGAFLLVWIHYGADEDWGIMCYPPMKAKVVQRGLSVCDLGPVRREVQDSAEGGYRTSSVFCPSL